MRRATAALGLAAIVIGAPVVLRWAVGAPGLASFEGASARYVPVEAVLGVIGLIAWVLWVYLALAVVVSLGAEVARMRGLPAGPALVAASATLAPALVRRMVKLAVGGALVAASVAGPRTVVSYDGAPPVAVTMEAASTASRVRSSESEAPQTRTYRVRAGDSLWRIAERELGSGFRWREIYRLNRGERFPGGGRLEHPRWIEPGWFLELPKDKDRQGSPGGSHGSDGEVPVDSSSNGHGEQPTPITSPEAPTTDPRPAPNGGSSPQEAEDPEIDVPARPVLNLPSGVSVAASFASGMLTAHLLGKLHRRRSRPATERAPIEEPPEPALTEDLRRAGGSPMPGVLDSALDAVVRAWREHRGTSPRLLAAIEAERAVRVFIDADEGQLPPASGGNLSPSVRFAQAGSVIQADVSGPFAPLLGRRLAPLERGLMVPMGRAPDGSALHVGILASGGVAVEGAKSESLARQMVLAVASQADPEDVHIVLLGNMELTEGLRLLPNVVVHDWNDAPAFVTETHAELLRRSRLFFEEGIEDVWAHVARHSDERLPALLLVATEPPADVRGVLEAIGAEGREAGAGLLTLGWQAAGSGVHADVPSTSALSISSDLPLPDTLAPFSLDEVASSEVIEILLKAYPNAAGDRLEEESPKRGPSLDSSPSSEYSRSQEVARLDGRLISSGAAPDRELERAPETDPEPKATGVPPSVVAVRCLGPFEVSREERLLRKGWRNKARELLAYLLAHRSGAPKDRIVEALWPSIDPAEGSERFDRMASEVRTRVRAADDSRKYIDREDDVFHLEAGVWWCDAWEFERLVATAEEDPGSEMARLREATQLYRGEFCRDYYYPWAESVRERLRSMAVRACARLADLLFDRGEREQALAVLDKAIEADPVSEDLTRRAMAIEAKLGRRAAALSRFRKLEAKLDADLDVEPDPETQTLARDLERESVPP